MNPDENKDTVSSSSSVSGEFNAAPEESLKIRKFEVSTIDTTTSHATTDLFSTYGFDIDKIARLANLSINDQEKEIYSGQLLRILAYIKQLNKVDTLDVEPTFNVTGQSNVMREDETVASLSHEEVLSNAPKKKNGLFETKGVFEG